MVFNLTKLSCLTLEDGRLGWTLRQASSAACQRKGIRLRAHAAVRQRLCLFSYIQGQLSSFLGTQLSVTIQKAQCPPPTACDKHLTIEIIQLKGPSITASNPSLHKPIAVLNVGTFFRPLDQSRIRMEGRQQGNVLDLLSVEDSRVEEN